MAVKTMSYEIVGWSGPEAKARWITLSDQCREIVNVIWQQWEVWHVQNGSCQIARKFASDLTAYRRGELDTRPKLDLKFMSPELSSTIYRALVTQFPTVHSRIIALLQSITQRRMTGKDVEGRWHVWLAVLLNRQGRPNATHNQPIPFDRQNSKPMKSIDGKNYLLSINLTRIPSEKKNSPSICDEVQLKARGSGLAIMKRIESGEYKFCGSSLVYNSSRNKWFALIAYDMGDSVDMREDGGTAVLRPRRTSPWALRASGRSWKFGGRGLYVSSTRQRLLTGRWSRQENYRHAGSSNKGHGRRRAMQGVQKLSDGWKDFVQTSNHILTAQIVKWCVENRVRKLIYMQPVDAFAASRFLSTAGKVPGREDSTSWDWYQIKKYLAYKCRNAGIHFETRKSGTREGGESGGRVVDKSPDRSPNGQKARKNKVSKKGAA